MSESRMRYLANNDSSRKDVSRYRKPDMTPEMGKFYYLYYVTLGLGEFNDVNNRVHNIYLLFDTGSDLMWTQCEGCRQCFYQNSPYFPRTRSQTYEPYPCDECPGGQCYQDHCTISKGYLDGMTMDGILATETFTFFSPSLYDETISGLIFACAMETIDFKPANAPSNPVTGILGMGKGALSLISQLGQHGEYRFSYCLQDGNNHGGAYSQMMLSFGDEIRSPPIMAVTQILTNPTRPSFYYVDLIDISVNNRRLNIPRRYFRMQRDNPGGTIFDSGTALSFLVSNAFDILKTGIERYVGRNNRNLRQYTNPNALGFEACWEPLFDWPTVSFPTITFHFGNNANMVVQPEQVVSSIAYPGVPDPGLYCLFLHRATTDNINIIGAFQQVNQRMITDVQTMQLSFAAEDCSQSTY